MHEIVRRLETEEVPDCHYCHGILKPDGIFFGEALPEKTLSDAIHHSRNCDLFIVIGSTLVVYPAAYMPTYAKDCGAELVIINLSPTPMDSSATVLVASKAGEAMTRIMEKRRAKLASEKYET